MKRRIDKQRAGFTLVELLVVISIIAILVGLLLAGVMNARAAIGRTQNKSRIDQISSGVATFCGAETYSRVGYLPPAPFTLKHTYNINEPEAVYLKQVFPNLLVNISAGTVSTGLPTTFAPVTFVDGNQVTTFFLTGGEITKYTGFSNNPQKPFDVGGAGEARKGPMSELQSNMYSLAANGQAQFIDPYGTPYIIFISKKSGDYVGQYLDWTNPPDATPPGACRIYPYKQANKYENPKLIQIISAGHNRAFGQTVPVTPTNNGDWSSGVDSNGRDDMTNFSRSPLGAGPGN